MIKYIIILIVGIAVVAWWHQEVIITGGGVAGVVSADIKRAMIKMGPLYDYKLYPDGTLKVKIKSQWLKLRY